MKTIFSTEQTQPSLVNQALLSTQQSTYTMSTGCSGKTGIIFHKNTGINSKPALQYIEAGKGLSLVGLPGQGALLALLIDIDGGLSFNGNGELVIDPKGIATQVELQVKEAIENGTIISPEEVPQVALDAVASEGYSKVAVSPFGFNLSKMTQTTEGDYTITIPGFVFEVENDTTGVVICDILHQEDGNSKLTFVGFSPDDMQGNDSFTAYALTNSDGTVFPVRPKTII